MDNRVSALAGVALAIAAVQSPAAVADDAHRLTAKFRTFYFNRDKDQGLNDSEALSQALRLDYVSGYAGGLLGFDASLFTVGKLAGDRGEGGTGILQDEGDGSQGGYTKFGQAYAKLRLGQAAELRGGRMVLDTPLFNDSDSRSTPSATQAAMLAGSWDALELYGIWSDKASAKTEDDFESYTDNRGNDYEVGVIGGGYRFGNGLSLAAAYGEADNVLRQTYFNASYPLALGQGRELLLDLHHYIGDADGNGALDSVGRDYDSNLTNIAAQLRMGAAKVTLSYQTVDGDEYEESWDGFNHDDNGLVTWNSVQRLDFDRADEDSWQARFDYAFASMPGLTFMTRYTSGDGIRSGGGHDGKEWERNVELQYQFPAVEGLSLRWRNSSVRSTETYNSDENRLILNYSHALL
ncbi:pyroglutatmate porin [Marinobacterium nitratireducens]|uniref:Pyroglutatmate porin n=1 Tax=Marinobacterium nitratireducens TaxID=518897 RepID=A0A918DTH7_9GAMM|nr:OprD family outer membrane porin [Marinobacterium nitratireducens]GGO81660.1 pyroglutatmate porin [Marinobacterium nitratireducens]